jgi:CheY-like chemotaxis protein
MDIFMPGMSGTETAQAIRELPECAAQTVIIAMSASIPRLEREHQTSAVWDEFLPKPVEAEQLLGLIEHSLHLEWRYAEQGATPEFQAVSPDAMIPPSHEELNDLNMLVQKGDLRGIQQYAVSLEARKPELQPFTRKLAQLAENYEDEAIHHLIVQFSSPNKTL